MADCAAVGHGPSARKLDNVDAEDHCHDSDYATHARRLIECLSDEIVWVYCESISFPASVKEVVTEKLEGRMMNEEVPDTAIETHTYLLKESRVLGAIGISAPAVTNAPEQQRFPDEQHL